MNLSLTIVVESEETKAKHKLASECVGQEFNQLFKQTEIF